MRLKRGSKHEFISGERPSFGARTVSECDGRAGNNAEHIFDMRTLLPALSGGRANAPALAWFADEIQKALRS